jgi:hypothetical protein
LKKVAAILLLSALLFNIIGYRFVFNYLEQKSVSILEQKIDAFAYNESELNEIAVPLNMPYYSDKSVENIYGEVEINGQHYQYVKRKIENNILHIWCLPNTEKNSLTASKNDVVKSNSQESNSNSNQKQNTVIKLLQTEFLPLVVYSFANTYSSTTQQQLVFNHSCISQFNPLGLIKPPNFS